MGSHFEIDRANLPVLVVEDDYEVRCLLQREIEDLGHPVTAADSAEQALSMLGEARFAVVITDIRMPGMDGVELTRRIKEDRPDTEVILVTGFASVDTASRALRLGAADYLTKPFGDIARINESLDKALEKQQQRHETRDRITRLEAERETLAHLLDRLPFGVILLNGDGRLSLANGAAETILGQRDGLEVTDVRHVRASSGGSALRELVSQATRPAPGARRLGGATTLERPSGATALSVLVTPLPTESIGKDEPVVAIFVSDPTRRAGTAEELLCRLYGMTPSEARIAAIVMQGRSVDEAASELDISTNTARTHLKRIFSKTGTTRQGDLISLLLSGPALLRLEKDG